MHKKSILITGCSSGIGLCTATELKHHGYRVFAAARKTADLDQLNAIGLESIMLDVTDPQSIQHALDEVLQKTGGTLYALFNNAGYMQTGAVEDLSSDIIRAQFETNVFGAMELARRVLPVMRKQGEGRIIQNSSILGVITLPLYGAYTASKFALEGFSHTLRQELRGTGIYVSILNPGPIISRLRDNAFVHYQKSLSPHHSPHSHRYHQLEQTYFHAQNRRFALPPEAAAKKVLTILQSRHPKAHYFVGWPAHTLAILRRFLPDRLLDWLLCNI